MRKREREQGKEKEKEGMTMIVKEKIGWSLGELCGWVLRGRCL